MDHVVPHLGRLARCTAEKSSLPECTVAKKKKQQDFYAMKKQAEQLLAKQPQKNCRTLQLLILHSVALENDVIKVLLFKFTIMQHTGPQSATLPLKMLLCFA